MFELIKMYMLWYDLFRTKLDVQISYTYFLSVKRSMLVTFIPIQPLSLKNTW